MVLFSACEAMEDIFSEVEYENKGLEVYEDSHEYIISEKASYFWISEMFFILKMQYCDTTLLHIMCSYNFL